MLNENSKTCARVFVCIRVERNADALLVTQYGSRPTVSSAVGFSLRGLFTQ